MPEQMLTKWIKAGYLHIKDAWGLPDWLLPEKSLNVAAEKIGDKGLLRISRPLVIRDGLERLLGRDPSALSAEQWQEALRRGPQLPQVKAVAEAFLEVADTIMAQFPRIQSTIDPMVICRSLAVLLYAPLVEQGKAVSAELGGLLGVKANEPAELVKSYAEAVVNGDIPTLEKVNQCIVGYSDWHQWALALQKEVLRCRLRPKLIAVTPPLSAELASVLAIIIKEGHHDESRGDHSGSSGQPILAQ